MAFKQLKLAKCNSRSSRAAHVLHVKEASFIERNECDAKVRAASAYPPEERYDPRLHDERHGIQELSIIDHTDLLCVIALPFYAEKEICEQGPATDTIEETPMAVKQQKVLSPSRNTGGTPRSGPAAQPGKIGLHAMFLAHAIDEAS